MLTDFGMAKELEENTRSNSMCGTVEYMSPELFLGRAMTRLLIGGVLGYCCLRCSLERLDL